MISETSLGLGNESPEETFFSPGRFVAGSKQNGGSLRIEGKRYAPHPATGIEAQFLHVDVTYTDQGVGIRATQLRAVNFEKPGSCKEPVLYRFRKIVELAFKFRMKLNGPFHCCSILLTEYNAKTITERLKSDGDRGQQKFQLMIVAAARHF